MAHELFGERFLSRSRPAWHNLGRVFDLNDHMTASQAIGEVAGDIRIERIPLILPMGDTQMEMEEGAIVRMPTVDEPDPEVFGVVKSAQFEVAQYSEFGAPLDPLSEAFLVETAGLLKGGRKLFLGLRGESFDVKGAASEEVRNYIVVVISQQPGVAHFIIHTCVRVVCENTLSYGTDKASLNIQIPHTAAAVDTVAFAAEVAAGMDKKTAEMKAIFNAMASTPLGKKGLDNILKAAFPAPTKPKSIRFLEENDIDLGSLADRDDKAMFNRISSAHDRWQTGRELASKRRDAAKELYATINDEHSAIAGTVYAGYQSVTELVDWSESKGGNPEYTTLFGWRAKQKAAAYGVSVHLAKVNMN